MAGPRRFDKRPQHAGDEGVSSEQQRERRCSRRRGELAQLAVRQCVRAEEVGCETVLRGRLPAEVREEHARVEEHPVTEFAQAHEERLWADLAIEEAERGARLTGSVASGRLHAALFGEHAHAAGRLRFEIRPHRRADPTRDDELALRCRDQPHERVDPRA